MAAVSSRYARALVEVILEQKLDPAAAREQVNSFAEAVRESRDLRRLWESPAISTEQKRKVLDAIAGQMGAFQPVRNFISVIIDHRRVPLLNDIARQFSTELDVQLGVVEAEISGSRPLAQQERQELEARIEVMTGKKVRARYSIDSRLLGGVMIRVGSTIYDGSIRGQLEKMKEQLSVG